MKYFVYYLYSKSLSIYYIGKTNNLNRRCAEHNNLEEIYTRRGVPWVLIGYIECEDNKEASEIEARLKRAKNKKYTKWYFEEHGITNM